MDGRFTGTTLALVHFSYSLIEIVWKGKKIHVSYLSLFLDKKKIKKGGGGKEYVFHPGR